MSNLGVLAVHCMSFRFGCQVQFRRNNRRISLPIICCYNQRQGELDLLSEPRQPSVKATVVLRKRSTASHTQHFPSFIHKMPSRSILLGDNSSSSTISTNSVFWGSGNSKAAWRTQFKTVRLLRPSNRLGAFQADNFWSYSA